MNLLEISREREKNVPIFMETCRKKLSIGFGMNFCFFPILKKNHSSNWKFRKNICPPFYFGCKTYCDRFELFKCSYYVCSPVQCEVKQLLIQANEHVVTIG